MVRYTTVCDVCGYMVTHTGKGAKEKAEQVKTSHEDEYRDHTVEINRK